MSSLSFQGRPFNWLRNPWYCGHSDKAVDRDDDEAKEGGVGHDEVSPDCSWRSLQENVWDSLSQTNEGYGDLLCQVSCLNILTYLRYKISF